MSPKKCGPATYRLVAALVALAICSSVARADEPIQWNTGAVVTASQTPAQLDASLTALAARGDARHMVVRFSEPVTSEQRAALAAAGLRLHGYVGSNAFFASVAPSGLNVTAAIAAAPMVDALPIERAWRMHRDYYKVEPEPHTIVSPPDSKATDPAEPVVVGAYVIFHPDITLQKGIDTVRQYDAKIRSELETINGLVIELPFDVIPALADEDAVQWIEPPLPKFGTLNDSNRAITGTDIVNAPPYDLDGTGVSVMVYDAGCGLASHVGFGGRLTVRDTSGTGDHATHTAGTIGGNGANSPGGGTAQRGMAPGVTIEAYGFEVEGGLQPGFLYSDPGDLEQDYTDGVNNHGVQISSNSIGSNVESNGYNCDWQGEYGVTASLIDSIVRGSLGAPHRVVWAAGNERQGSRCQTEGHGEYYSIAPPSGAKNHLCIGAMNSNDDSVTYFTSWGPTDDGRLKPDFSGPGCQSGGDGGVTSTSSNGGYNTKCGTSMSCPTVAGLSALLLQDWAALYPGAPDPRNSTLKVVFAQTAVDLQNPGPDYKTGYGSVRIQPAIDLVRAENFLEAEVSQGGMFSALIIVAPGDPEMKVTLAWDDAPGTPNVYPSLVNDLDLVVYGPSGAQHFPWTLDPNNPSAAAVANQADHVNNIEQVAVSSPAPGAYRVEVHGFNVPQGPQPFSLAGSPYVVNCSTAGVISLGNKFACESTATIQVVDCDLNTSDATIEQIVVPIVSGSEPTGEMVTLTETAAESAAFMGTITLSETDAAGVLLIGHGDTVTATYIDEDDGFGNLNVTVEASGVVDCVGPIISNVQTIDIEPRAATVTFDTDEDASGTVFYGTSCAGTTNEASANGSNTNHSIIIGGLQDASTYFYRIEVADQAGNPAADDNGGACYTFSTPDIPDFFTEQFEGDHDLDNTMITFTPNGTVDYYSACAEAITALPTDPTGGTTLSMSDDTSAVMNFTGGQTVSLYGTTWGSAYAGSNGYVTFGGGDSDYSESLTDHFTMPRISGVYDDLNPSSGGTVSWRQLADRVAVTWDGVHEYGTTGPCTFQIEMFFDGRLAISYLSIASDDSIAGLSEGSGLSPDFLESDLSNANGCGPTDCNNNGTPDDEDIANCPPGDAACADCNNNEFPDECDLGGVSADCNGNGIPDECDTADGTEPDCNNNSVPDACDVSSGNSGDCNSNGIPDECDTADGTEPDCNNNSVPDGCDVSSGSSDDCNSNGVPDECDVAGGSDCNTNGVPDECDLAAGTSEDCNGNNQPDECDIANCPFPPFCVDCNLNGVPDNCDIADGTEEDCNRNFIPDTCDIAECAGGPACDDCNGNGILDGCDIADGAVDGDANGIPDVCDLTAPMVAGEGPRFLAVTPQPPDILVPVALQLTGAAGDADIACVSTYVQLDGTLGAAPVYQLPADWSTVHAHGDEILPGKTYELQSRLSDGLLSSAGSGTTWMWGDVNNNGIVNFTDINIVVQGFQGDFSQAPIEAVDLDPCIPNGDINFEDINRAVQAFQGQPFTASGCAIPCP